jgi:hypothetical protein
MCTLFLRSNRFDDTAFWLFVTARRNCSTKISWKSCLYLYYCVQLRRGEEVFARILLNQFPLKLVAHCIPVCIDHKRGCSLLGYTKYSYNASDRQGLYVVVGYPEYFKHDIVLKFVIFL